MRDTGHFITHSSSKASSFPLHTLSLSLLGFSFTFLHPLAFIWLSFTFFTRLLVSDFFGGIIGPGASLKAFRAYKGLR